MMRVEWDIRIIFIIYISIKIMNRNPIFPLCEVAAVAYHNFSKRSISAGKFGDLASKC